MNIKIEGGVLNVKDAKFKVGTVLLCKYEGGKKEDETFIRILGGNECLNFYSNPPDYLKEIGWDFIEKTNLNAMTVEDVTDKVTITFTIKR